MGDAEMARQGNPWPSPTTAITFALRVSAALIARDPGLAISTTPVSRDELLRVVDPATGAGVGFDAYRGLTDREGDSIFPWEWLLNMEPQDAAGEISTHWLQSASALLPIWEPSGQAQTEETTLSVLAFVLSTNASDGARSRQFWIEGASRYNARGGTAHIDALLEPELDSYGSAGTRIDERLWLVWCNSMFIAALDMDGLLITPPGGYRQVENVVPGRVGAVATSLAIMQMEQALHQSASLQRTTPPGVDTVTLQHTLEGRIHDVWTAIVDEGHLWGLQRGEVALGIDFQGTDVDNWLFGPDGRRGQIVESGQHILLWTWSEPGKMSGQGSVHLRVTELDGETTLEVVENVALEGAERAASSFWRRWFEALEDWLQFPIRQPSSPGSVRGQRRALWIPHDPRLSELEATATLRARDLKSISDILAEVPLRALQCRALAAQGKLDEAGRVLEETFSGFKEAPAWVPTLQALERGRISKQRALLAAEGEPREVNDLWTEAAYDLAQSIWIAPGEDVDLVLEAAWELATMHTTGDGPGYTSMWIEFGRAVAARAPREVRDSWLHKFTEM
ncbi:MAG: hypothetical protein Q7T17_07535 [Microbacterium sp.]|uniref:hypothetical protein n=1 Tax=Microbacterium sp. TaxID=51671 RepID=UPI00271C9801|nr:hypothetical protein [Microbacterium sp.]MDO8382813.1 hypothetical protein [Microbacterium sp.]